MSGPSGLVASIAMLATLALGWGGIWLILKRQDRLHGALKIVAAVVLFANVLIWTWPTQ